MNGADGTTLQKASAEEAAAALEGEAVQGGTTAKIFPDFVETPEEEPVDEPVANTPPSEKEPETKPEESTPTDDLWTVKVEGEEQKKTREEVLKGYQTDQYLTKKGQQIAEEKRVLEELKKEILEKNAVTQQPSEPEEEDEFYTEYIAPHVTGLKSEIESLKATVSELTEVTRPTVYQTVVSQLDSELKGDGLTDFKEKLPLVEAALQALPENQFVAMNNKEGLKSIYKDLKLKELLGQGKTVEKVDERPAPNVESIVEGGNSTSSGTDDGLAKYQAAFKLAQETGDWTEVLEMKGLFRS